ncbi:MAG: PepSY domain-containing protein [Sulfuriferula sp.]
MNTPAQKPARYFRIVSIAMVTALFGAATAAHAYSGEKLAPSAKITITEARTIAVKTYPGKIVKAELEKEKGGSGLRYSFDIRHGKVTHEVGVDAQTGKVLENGPDSD